MNDVFITENFLLQNDRAVELYHRYARQLPIIDYHCHLPPAEIAADRRFENLSQIWLHGDHYKWRAMRTAGVPERYCTGDASDWEKFQKWAETVPQTLRNPLYHWTHLELKRPFGISDRLLDPDDGAGHLGRVQREARPARVFRPRHHAADERRAGLHDRRSDRHAGASPGHRGRRVVLDRGAAGVPARQGDGRRIARGLQRLDRSARRRAGSTWATISIAFSTPCGSGTISSTPPAAGFPTTASRRFTPRTTRRRDRGRVPARPKRQDASAGEIVEFKSAMLYELAAMNCEKGWVQQFHFGAMRNNNTRMFQTLGPDTGFDSIGDFEVARPWRDFSTGWTATAGWPRRFSTISIRPTTKSWPR